MKKVKVVVAGSGFAGLKTALTLKKLNKDLDITVIDRYWIHLYASSLYKLDIGEISPSDIGFDLAKLYKKKGINFVEDSVKKIDYKKNIVKCKNNSYKYNYLVLALGCETNYFNIPNLKKYGLPLKTIDDALKIKEAIRTKIKNKNLSIIIGGGGLTGVEVASELVDWGKKNFNKKLNIFIVEALDHLVRELGEKTSHFTLNYLEKQGIKINLSNPIIKVNKKFVFLKNGSQLKYDMLIWAGGIRAPSILSDSGLRSNNKGCLAVTNTLRLVGINNIFSAGDCSWCFDYKTRKFVAQTAHNAIEQGKIAGYNIAREIQKEKLISYQLSQAPVIMSLGHKMGVFVYKDLMVYGRPVLWLKALIQRFYMFNAKR